MKVIKVGIYGEMRFDMRKEISVIKLFITLLIIITLILVIQINQKNKIIDDLYKIIESHNEALIDHNFMLREIVIDNDIIFEMVEAITGKMLWEMEW